MGIEKVEKVEANVHDKKNLIHIKILKQTLNHELVLKKFNKILWLKPYIDMNTQIRENAKNDFKKGLFKLMKNILFEKLWKM